MKRDGLYNRYEISKTDGTDVDPDAEYFVLRMDNKGSDAKHIAASRIAVQAYANAIEDHLPQLASDLRKRYPIKQRDMTFKVGGIYEVHWLDSCGNHGGWGDITDLPTLKPTSVISYGVCKIVHKDYIVLVPHVAEDCGEGNKGQVWGNIAIPTKCIISKKQFNNLSGKE